MNANDAATIQANALRIKALLVQLGQQWGGENVSENVPMPLNFPKTPDNIKELSPEQLQAWANDLQASVKNMTPPTEWEEYKKRFDIVHKGRNSACLTLYLWYGSRATFVDEDIYDSYDFIKGQFAYVTILFKPDQQFMWEFYFRKPAIREEFSSFEELEATLRNKWSELEFEDINVK